MDESNKRQLQRGALFNWKQRKIVLCTEHFIPEALDIVNRPLVHTGEHGELTTEAAEGENTPGPSGHIRKKGDTPQSSFGSYMDSNSTAASQIDPRRACPVNLPSEAGSSFIPTARVQLKINWSSQKNLSLHPAARLCIVCKDFTLDYSTLPEDRMEREMLIARLTANQQKSTANWKMWRGIAFCTKHITPQTVDTIAVAIAQLNKREWRSRNNFRTDIENRAKNIQSEATPADPKKTLTTVSLDRGSLEKTKEKSLSSLHRPRLCYERTMMSSHESSDETDVDEHAATVSANEDVKAKLRMRLLLKKAEKRKEMENRIYNAKRKKMALEEAKEARIRSFPAESANLIIERMNEQAREARQKWCSSNAIEAKPEAASRFEQRIQKLRAEEQERVAPVRRTTAAAAHLPQLSIPSGSGVKRVVATRPSEGLKKIRIVTANRATDVQSERNSPRFVVLKKQDCHTESAADVKMEEETKKETGTVSSTPHSLPSVAGTRKVVIIRRANVDGASGPSSHKPTPEPSLDAVKSFLASAKLPGGQSTVGGNAQNVKEGPTPGTTPIAVPRTPLVVAKKPSNTPVQFRTVSGKKVELLKPSTLMEPKEEEVPTELPLTVRTFLNENPTINAEKLSAGLKLKNFTKQRTAEPSRDRLRMEMEMSNLEQDSIRLEEELQCKEFHLLKNIKDGVFDGKKLTVDEVARSFYELLNIITTKLFDILEYAMVIVRDLLAKYWDVLHHNNMVITEWNDAKRRLFGEELEDAIEKREILSTIQLETLLRDAIGFPAKYQEGTLRTRSNPNYPLILAETMHAFRLQLKRAMPRASDFQKKLCCDLRKKVHEDPDWREKHGYTKPYRPQRNYCFMPDEHAERRRAKLRSRWAENEKKKEKLREAEGEAYDEANEEPEETSDDVVMAVASGEAETDAGMKNEERDDGPCCVAMPV